MKWFHRWNGCFFYIAALCVHCVPLICFYVHVFIQFSNHLWIIIVDIQVQAEEKRKNEPRLFIINAKRIRFDSYGPKNVCRHSVKRAI